MKKVGRGFHRIEVLRTDWTKAEPGLMGLCAFMSDLMNMHCRSFTKQAAFCLITQEQDIVNLWSKIEVATKTGSSDLEDLTPKFQEKMMAYCESSQRTSYRLTWY